MIQLPTDSSDYHLLTKGVELSANVSGLTCEIGLRRGGGTKFIIDALKATGQSKVHIAIDPYGHIEYEHKQDQPVRLDYTNQMRDECLTNLYAYCRQVDQPFIFFNLTDTDFFERYSDGVPVYDLERVVYYHYSFVHYDGPHSVDPLIKEIDFFSPRTQKGGVWCFDDVEGYYDHDVIEKYVLDLGFTLIEKTSHKALYAKN